MSAAYDLDWLLDRARSASEHVMEERDQARRSAVKTIRDLERRVRDVIAGDTLRGMANLHPVRGAIAQQGARVTGRDGGRDFGLAKVQSRVDEPIPFGRDALVVSKDADLVVFEVGARGEFCSRPVQDCELTAQDLDAVIATIVVVLRRHVARAEKTAANYERLRALAGSIGSVLEDQTRV